MRCALIGNPSVGKSLIFRQLTGVGVEVSNYPGTTVELSRGTSCHGRSRIEVVDLPGVYSLEGESEEEVLVREFLAEEQTDVIVAVLDVTRLERNIYLLLQVAEYHLPLVVVLNMTDEAEQAGLDVEPEALASVLGVEVICTAALHGRNMDLLLPAVLRAEVPRAEVPYDHHLEAAVRSLQKMFGITRQESLAALRQAAPSSGAPGDQSDLQEAASTIAAEIESRHRMTVGQIIAANRHNYARRLAEAVLTRQDRSPVPDPDRYLTRAIPGIPLLIAVLLGMLTFVFVVGSFLEDLIVTAMQMYVIDPFLALGFSPLPETIGRAVLVAIQAGMGIAFPFIFIFFILLSILEDTGYMSRAAFLSDDVMHRLGMHGGAIIPMMLGFGCNVPALMGARVLGSRRERLIAAWLISMVPCSARTVVIAGLVAAYLGLVPALSIYGVVVVLILATGIVLSRVAPGEQVGMIMEMAPLRKPQIRMVLSKSWLRLKEFFFIAMPFLLVGSVILGLCQYGGLVEVFEQVVDPISQAVLGLPGFAAAALLFGILRKEMAIETLAILGGTSDIGAFLSGLQIYVFAIVTVLFIPCISTVAVLVREYGTRAALLISGYTVALGIIIGSLITHLLR